VSRVFTPKLERTLLDRELHVENLLKAANKLKNEADKLEKDSIIALENAKIDSNAAESKVISAFREQSLREKDTLYELFSEKSKIESESLMKSSEDAFQSVSANMDEIVDEALAGVSCSMREKQCT
jgi:F0F1-type ATP synthase membrane subunit b/b'